MLRPPPAILIQGLGGVGKTTLARGFVEWLEATGGIGIGCMWFAFNEIRSAEFVINRMGEALFGGQFAAAPLDQRIDALAHALRDNRIVIVWDNFESAHGMDGTSVAANLPSGDWGLLKSLLKKLHGGASKVIITSRSPERWLGDEICYDLPIAGLDGDERWEYCELVLHNLGLTVDRNQPDMIQLMHQLGGHPLAMRAILPELKRRSAKSLAEALRTSHDALDLPEGDVSRKLAATLRFVEQSLPEELQPLLVPLSLHENFVVGRELEYMAKSVDAGITRERIDRLFAALETAGLVRDRGNSIHELHPALSGYLRAAVGKSSAASGRDSWTRAFVDVMGRLADHFAPKELHEQRGVFQIQGANFHHALAQAERLAMEQHFAALTQSLATFAQNTRNFTEADRLFAGLAEARAKVGDEKGVAGAYHQRGRVAQEQHDFAAAEQCYRKSLAISEELGNDPKAARTYGQLGNLHLERREFVAAAEAYHASLRITERLADNTTSAITYHQLGMVAEEQRDFAAAEQWYRKSLTIKEKQGNNHGAAGTYHQLGNIAEAQRDFAAAEQWYRKSLAIEEKQGNEHGAALTYHQLGIIAHERRDFAAAEQWYRKSLAIVEKQGDEHGAASTLAQLGILAGLRKQFLEAGSYLARSVVLFAHCNDAHSAQQIARNFMVVHKQASTGDRARLAAIWREAGLPDLPQFADPSAGQNQSG